MSRECTKHDGDALDLDDCPECIAWMEAEEKYWFGYFGGAATFKAENDRRREEREAYGHELTDEQRMEEARRLK